MSVTITRATNVDDDSSGETGTIVDAAYMTALYDAIDAALARPQQPRTQAVTSAATVTPTFDTVELVTITAQAAALTLANPSPVTTVVQGSRLVIRIKDNGTARGLTYGTQYRAMGTALPSTTVISKTLYLTFIWNATDTKWDLIHAAQEA